MSKTQWGLSALLCRRSRPCRVRSPRQVQLQVQGRMRRAVRLRRPHRFVLHGRHGFRPVSHAGATPKKTSCKADIRHFELQDTYCEETGGYGQLFGSEIPQRMRSSTLAVPAGIFPWGKCSHWQPPLSARSSRAATVIKRSSNFFTQGANPPSGCDTQPPLGTSLRRSGKSSGQERVSLGAGAAAQMFH